MIDPLDKRIDFVLNVILVALVGISITWMNMSCVVLQ